MQIDTGVTAIAAGAWHSLYIKSNGSLWGMGNNADGRLGIMQMYANVSYSTQVFGQGTTILYPTQIVGSGVVGAAGGGWHSLIWKNDGSLWAMGDNSQGQLGTGDTTGHYLPTQVLPNGVIMASAGFDFSLVVELSLIHISEPTRPY